MPTFRILWKETINAWATVDAESEEEAIEKAKLGEYNDDKDTDPADGKGRYYQCDGEV